MKQIDKNVRHAILELVHDMIGLHPEVNENTTETPPFKCRICRDVYDLMQLLDAEQREYGPPIDVTDASYLRERAKAQAAGGRRDGERNGA